VRIVYLHQYLVTPAMYGGSRPYEMARRLARFGHEVHVVTSRREAENEGAGGWTSTEEDGFRAHWIPVPYSQRMGYRERMVAFSRFSVLAAPRAARLRPDIVLASSTPLTVALPGVYAAKRNRVPMVFEVRDLWPAMPIAMGALKNPLSIAAARRLERFAYQHARHVVALSPTMKEAIVATGYPTERVTVIPNSCDLSLFDIGPEHGQEVRARFAWLGQRPLVLYAGTLGRVNGVAYLARLARATLDRDPEVRFLVVGKGSEEEVVRCTAEQLGVSGKNFFAIPGVPKADVPALFSAATIATSLFVDLDEMWANSANKFFDALAAARPVAINYGGWQAELITETGCGLVLDPHDINGAAERLVTAIRDPAWLTRAGAAARRLGQERFDRERLAAQLDQLLRDVVAAPRRSGQ
jgi:glycosyltransferase involved in cell wall biosynthesis